MFSVVAKKHTTLLTNFSPCFQCLEKMSYNKNLFLANAALTIPFGIIALVAPAFTFEVFGVQNIDFALQSIIRGYGSAALGYGIIMYQSQNIPHVHHRSFLVGSIAFNITEIILQGNVTLTPNSGINNMIWTTFLSHTFLGLWSLYYFLTFTVKPIATKEK
jgi:hypothetical protein